MVTDISRGGLGFDSYLFLPRMCEGKVRIFDEATTVSQIEPEHPCLPILEARVKIKRVLLQGQDPSYQIGIAFLDPPDNIEGTVCEQCGGTVKIVAAVTEPSSIRTYLDGVGLPAPAPPIAPATHTQSDLPNASPTAPFHLRHICNPG